MQRRGTWRWCVRRPEQVQPAVGLVADFGDALRCDRGGRDAVRRGPEHLDVAAPITHTESMATRGRAGGDRGARRRGPEADADGRLVTAYGYADLLGA